MSDVGLINRPTNLSRRSSTHVPVVCHVVDGVDGIVVGVSLVNREVVNAAVVVSATEAVNEKVYFHTLFRG